MNATKNLDARFATVRRARAAAPKAAGFKLLEMVIVVALGTIMTALALPSYKSTMTSLHLQSAASSLSSGIQAARFYAISTGCPAQVTVSAYTYQVSTEFLIGPPPSCGATYTAIAAGMPLGGTIPYTATNGDVSLTPATTQTLQINANGTVTAAGTTTPPITYSLVLGLTNSAGAAQKTVSVSGMGYVKVM